MNAGGHRIGSLIEEGKELPVLFDLDLRERAESPQVLGPGLSFDPTIVNDVPSAVGPVSVRLQEDHDGPWAKKYLDVPAHSITIVPTSTRLSR